MALPNGCDKLARDFDGFWLKFYKSSCLSPNFQRLPRCWNVKDRSRSLRLSHFALTVSFSSGFNERHDSSYNAQEAACVRSDASIPLTTGIYYFETTLLNKGPNSCVSVGVSMKTSSLVKFPGSENNSFGYQSDGCVYHGSPTSFTKFGPRFNENDIIGCGVDFLSQSLFFTRNGVFLGKAFEGKVPVGAGTRLFPTIGLQGRGVRVTTNFGQQPFYFAFENHLKTERISRENKLIEHTCKEDFAGIKIKELVSGYLIHHGYVATAKAFSYWSNLASSIQNSEVQANQIENFNDKISNRSNLVSSSSETNIGTNSDVIYKESNPSLLQRRHSDSACLDTANTNPHLGQLPGIASMLHRRRLRALCRRCQYGRAAATLNRFYPQVLERCPELLVQLRCRQLIEMMRRHAVRRGRSHASNSGSDLNDSSPTTAPPKVQKVSGSLHVGSRCCVITNKQDKSLEDSSSSAQTIIENGFPRSSMDVDLEDVLKVSFPENSNKVLEQKSKTDQDRNTFTEFDDDLETVDVEDEDDDDSFGADDDTGVCIDSLCPPTNSEISQSNNGSCVPSEMDVDSEVSSAGSTSKSTKDASYTLSANSELASDNEMRCLLRHVQFGRSLVNLVRQVRAKTGGLSLETERLLQQSVSLLAYPSPTSNDCPLRGLLDPVWRDTIASIINSAVLKAHDLPAQPALEHGLRALQRCFQDKNFVEAQTLGHFLLYHLTPSQIAKADEAVAAMEASVEHQTGKRLRSSLSQSNGDHINEPDDNTSSGSRSTEINGHNTVRRRARRQRRRRADGTVSESQSSEPTDDPVPSHRPNTRSRQASSTGAQNDNIPSENRGSNGSSSGRVHSSNSSNNALLTLTATVPPHIRLGRQTILTRFCPAFVLDSNRARLATSISNSPVSSFHRSSAPSRRFTSTTSTRIDNNQLRRSETANSHFDSAFRGLLSMSYPHHAEFLAAMDDALKAYAGSLLLTEDEQVSISNPQNGNLRGDPPSPTGGGACT
ncbi:Ran-binding protein [Schistosoma japonicum]|uniref:Ran-binding protein n=1 Tax=Schistosoma japonicum TaxID=6182 RepID=A0A4Z2D4J3_SCHJA|nr:Ran-binding protein [Schistosoma japonicum]